MNNRVATTFVFEATLSFFVYIHLQNTDENDEIQLFMTYLKINISSSSSAG